MEAESTPVVEVESTPDVAPARPALDADLRQWSRRTFRTATFAVPRGRPGGRRVARSEPIRASLELWVAVPPIWARCRGAAPRRCRPVAGMGRVPGTTPHRVRPASAVARPPQRPSRAAVRNRAPGARARASAEICGVLGRRVRHGIAIPLGLLASSRGPAHRQRLGAPDAIDGDRTSRGGPGRDPRSGARRAGDEPQRAHHARLWRGRDGPRRGRVRGRRGSAPPAASERTPSASDSASSASPCSSSSCGHASARRSSGPRCCTQRICLCTCSIRSVISTRSIRSVISTRPTFRGRWTRAWNGRASCRNCRR